MVRKVCRMSFYCAEQHTAGNLLGQCMQKKLYIFCCKCVHPENIHET